MNTGIWSSSANSINVSLAGTQRMDFTGSTIQTAIPIQYQDGTQTTPQIYFGTDTTSGFYRPVTNNVAITTNGNIRFNVATTGINCSLPLTLPSTGGTASKLDHYEETTHSTTFTYGNKTLANTTITFRRIGKIVFIFIPSIDYLTNTNGLNVGSFSNTSLLSRFRPQSNTTFSNIYSE